MQNLALDKSVSICYIVSALNNHWQHKEIVTIHGINRWLYSVVKKYFTTEIRIGSLIAFITRFKLQKLQVKWWPSCCQYVVVTTKRLVTMYSLKDAIIRMKADGHIMRHQSLEGTIHYDLVRDCLIHKRKPLQIRMPLLNDGWSSIQDKEGVYWLTKETIHIDGLEWDI